MKQAVLLLALLVPSPELAVRPWSQSQTLHPVADGMVYEGNPDKNQASSDFLRVRWRSHDSYRSFLRFEVPEGPQVLSARLRLYCTDPSPDSGWLHQVFDNGWTEADLTWETQPMQTVQVIAPMGPASAGSWLELDVSSIVTSPGTYVFAVTLGCKNSVYYSAREGSHPPQLVLARAAWGGGSVADFSAAPVSGLVPLQVAFTDLSTGPIWGWTWSFGDGATSNEADPQHTYQSQGDYDVTLTVSGPGGTSTIVKEELVHVDAADLHGVWSSAAEIAQLPASGAAWNALLTEANLFTGTPDVSNQDDNTDVRVLAKALVFARTGNEAYRTQVVTACLQAIGTEVGGNTLALGRNLAPYVIAADLVGLPPAADDLFRAWLSQCLIENLGGRTLQSTHEDRPNNWGTHAGASRAAVAVYLADELELERCAKVFKGWLGDRTSYAGFKYGDLDWQADPQKPVGINPLGSSKQGHSIDGVLPDDQRRSGGFTWPPPKENYVWEALQGALVQAVILHRAGYDTWDWEDQALLRAVRWLHEECSFPAQGDDTWQPHLINQFYGEDFPAPVPSKSGKNMGWTDWTHASP